MQLLFCLQKHYKLANWYLYCIIIIYAFVYYVNVMDILAYDVTIMIIKSVNELLGLSYWWYT